MDTNPLADSSSCRSFQATIARQILLPTIPFDLLAFLRRSPHLDPRCSVAIKREGIGSIYLFHYNVIHQFLVGNPLEKRESVEMLDHPDMQVFNVGDGVYDASWS